MGSNDWIWTFQKCQEFQNKFKEIINPKLNQDFKVKIEEFVDIFKVLIEMNTSENTKLTELWFPVCMKRHKEWIIHELPTKISRNTIKPLADGILKCLISDKSKDVPD